ncbi:MAG: DivIVA domain-containing protein [Ekhidna sp.]|nr:DivIVA domain-containing protein [Ekhidna sp.]MBC6426342.1 DivIVA domain-containing protein [Ekhidna sp.]
MKITPLEIRQKDFEKKLRGYDRDEVNAFLQSLSNEWERMLEENKGLSLKLQQAEKEVAKLREVESSLYKTLKTAEDTGANVIEQANKAAELHMKETQMNAEGLLNESKNKARAMIEEAEAEARQIIEELQEAVKAIQQNHQDIQNQRDIALQELKNLSVTLIEKVERNAQETKEFKLDDYVKRVKKLARESEERIRAEKTQVSVENKPAKVITVKENENIKPIHKKPEQPKLESVQETPKPLELKERIIERQKTEDDADSIVKTGTEEVEEKVERVKKRTTKVEDVVPRKKPKKENEPVVVEEGPPKKGPRIARTVSFFDELDKDH